MNRNQIRDAIKTHVDRWLKYITDDSVREAIKKDIIVTGGCITSMLLNEPVNDFDIYFRSKESVLKVIEHYTKVFIPEDAPQTVDLMGLSNVTVPSRFSFREINPGLVSSGIKIVIDGNKRIAYDKGDPIRSMVKCISGNAISLPDKTQCVVRFFGNPNVIHSNFDFVHCTNYWQSIDNSLFLNSSAVEATLLKELKFNEGCSYPIGAAVRVSKFVKRGWSISGREYLKIMKKVSELDLDNPEVFADHSIGVSDPELSITN